MLGGARDVVTGGCRDMDEHVRSILSHVNNPHPTIISFKSTLW